MDSFTELNDRLSRLETRVVRGFLELGVDVTQVDTKPVCIPDEKRILVRSMSTPLASLFKAALDNGLDVGYAEITVEYDGSPILKL
jgi:hypothetical protein